MIISGFQVPPDYADEVPAAACSHNHITEMKSLPERRPPDGSAASQRADNAHPPGQRSGVDQRRADARRQSPRERCKALALTLAHAGARRSAAHLLAPVRRLWTLRAAARGRLSLQHTELFSLAAFHASRSPASTARPERTHPDSSVEVRFRPRSFCAAPHAHMHADSMQTHARADISVPSSRFTQPVCTDSAAAKSAAARLQHESGM